MGFWMHWTSEGAFEWFWSELIWLGLFGVAWWGLSWNREKMGLWGLTTADLNWTDSDWNCGELHGEFGWI
jgi:hypothetical protein